MSDSDITRRVGAILSQVEGLKYHYDPPVEPGSSGAFANFESLGLHPELLTHLRTTFPHGLYRHQESAVRHITAGLNTVVATRTSSGKSLIFTLPVYQKLIGEPASTALFLYPQKALANDQLGRLRETAKALPSLARILERAPSLISRYDGATEQASRAQIRSEVQVLLTNPDMLHIGILQHHERHWARFFKNLRHVIVDECHEYRGIFGTNVAYILRRLRQVCALHGSAPVFVATSATISEPKAHLETLTGLPFTLVGSESDGSIQGKKKYWVVSSPDNYVDLGRKLTIALGEAGLSTLAFCPSRVAAERMVARIRSSANHDRSFVRVYRAGLSATEREDIENSLREGRLRAVFSTSALELGIDIGALDCVVCIGLPSSMMSLWQRAGRAARAGKEGSIILIPAEVPIDSYYAEHPEELFARANEPLVLTLHNKRVICQHFACATQEVGGDEDKLHFDILGDAFATVRKLRADGRLNNDIFYRDSPHAEVAIRGAGTSNYKLMDGQLTIGETDEYHLLRECPRNAIYRHDGRSYRVKDVIPGKRLVLLFSEHTGNDTYPFVQKKIRLRQRLKVADYSEASVETVRIDVTESLLQVVEKDRSGKVINTWPGSAGMPTLRLPTEGTRMVVKKALWDRLVEQSGQSATRLALQSIERLAYSLFPTVSGPCDTQDFSAASVIEESGQAVLYLYDTIYDGVDLTTAAFDNMPHLLARSLERIDTCDCKVDEGCFKCIANPRAPDPASKRVTSRVLKALSDSLSGQPSVALLSDSSLENQLTDEVQVLCPACGQPVSGASKFCNNCGTRMAT